MRARRRREKNGRDTHVGKEGKRIVEFVGLVYMCEVRGQNRTKKKTNETHRGHERGHVPMDISI